MPGRVRDRSFTFPVSGTSINGVVETQHTGYHVFTDYCTDVIGNWPRPNPLYLVKHRKVIPRVDGVRYRPGTDYKISQVIGCPGGTAYASSPVMYYPDYETIDLSNAAWDILARTNPSKPIISIPTFIGELKDAPLLVEGWAGSLLQRVAKGHVSWRWAIKPFLSEMRTLIAFAESVDNRIREFVRLRDEGFIKKRCSLPSRDNISSTTSNVWIWSTLGIVSTDRISLCTEKCWGSAQWRVDPSWDPPLLDRGILNYSERVLLGITSRGALQTAWELFPFSWFTDWLVGLGQFMAASDSTVPCTPSNLCLMRTLSSKLKYAFRPDLSTYYMSMSGRAISTMTVKTRVVLPLPSTLPPTSLPAFSRANWSILGSLAVLMTKRG